MSKKPVPTFKQLMPEYARLWSAIEVRPSKANDIDFMARLIIKNKPRYQEIQAKTGVPWAFVGVLHGRESTCSFAKHLHEGSSLKARTKWVPKGHPRTGSPPFTWEFSACDALRLKGLQHVKVWSVERMCYEAERYNGWGYRLYHSETLSPYLWSGANHYTRGKYIADGQWSATTPDAQSGVMPVLKRISELDPSFALFSELDKKSVVATVRNSPSVSAQSNGLLALGAAFVASLWDGISNGAASVYQWAGEAIGALPSVSESVTTTKGLFTTIDLPWTMLVGVSVAGACLFYSISRQVAQKRVVK